MASGFLTPDARLRVLSDLGVVLPGAKLHAYVAGTPSTNLDTYSDSALTIPNTNPVVASAGGLFGPIYLTKGVTYKLVLTDSADVVVWSQDNVPVPTDNSLVAGTGITLATVAGVTTISASAAAVASVDVNDFRLTLESGVPVSVTDQLAKTTVYCTPCGRGNRMDLYDGAGVPTTLTSAQVSIALPATTSQLYDVFAYNNAGVLTLELLAWTNDTTRATALVLTTTGSYTKSGDLTRRYLGSVRTTTVAGQTENSLVKRYLWNYSNRVPLLLRAVEATDSWPYTIATWRQANAAAANQLDFVLGVADTIVEAEAVGTVTSGTNPFTWIGIGYDSTVAPDAGCLVLAGIPGGSAGGGANPAARLKKYPLAGRHTLVWLEKSQAVGTTTWYGDNAGDGTQSGIHGRLDG